MEPKDIRESRTNGYHWEQGCLPDCEGVHYYIGRYDNGFFCVEKEVFETWGNSY